MITIRDTDEDFIIDFFPLESWDDFETIIDTLGKAYDVQVIDRIEGPESRIRDITLDALPFSLHNNPYGNSLKAKDAASIQYLKEILPRLTVLFP